MNINKQPMGCDAQMASGGKLSQGKAQGIFGGGGNVLEEMSS